MRASQPRSDAFGRPRCAIALSLPLEHSPKLSEQANIGEILPFLTFLMKCLNATCVGEMRLRLTVQSMTTPLL